MVGGDVKYIVMVFSLCALVSSCKEVDGVNGVSKKSETLAPGDVLTFKHGLNAAIISSQFKHLGGVYDIADFSTVFLPNDTQAGVKYYPALNSMSGNNRDYDRGPIVWSEGEGFRAVFAYREGGEKHITSFSFNKQGESASSAFDIGSSFDDVYAAKISDTQFSLMRAESGEIFLSVYNRDGSLSAGPVKMDGHGFYDEGEPMVMDAGGNIVACTFSSGSGSSGGDQIVQLEVYSPALNAAPSITTVADFSANSQGHDADSCVLGLLPNGNLIVVYDAFNESGVMAITASIFDNAKQLVKSTVLSETYSYDMSIAIADNGNTLVVYELGGPDATGFAVLDQQGELLSQPDLLSDNEPDEVLAAVFADGSFAAVHFEDDSIAATMNIITNTGVMLPEQDFIAPLSPIGYAKPMAITASDSSFLFFYGAYEEESGFQFVEVFKNRLVLNAVSDEDVTLTNQSQHTVEVVLTAVGQ